MGGPSLLAASFAELLDCLHQQGVSLPPCGARLHPGIARSSYPGCPTLRPLPPHTISPSPYTLYARAVIAPRRRIGDTAISAGAFLSFLASLHAQCVRMPRRLSLCSSTSIKALLPAG